MKDLILRAVRDAARIRMRTSKSSPTVSFAAAIALMLACTGASAQTAKQDYDQLCAACHGPGGKGNGTSPSVMPTTPMPDLTQLTKRHGGTFPFDEVVSEIDGRKSIPSHARIEMSFWGVTMQEPGREFSPESDAAVKQRITALAKFVESLQEK